MNDFLPIEPGNNPLSSYLAQAEQVLGTTRAAAQRGQVTPALIEYVAETAATFADLIFEKTFPDLSRAQELYAQLKAEYLSLYRLAQVHAV